MKTVYILINEAMPGIIKIGWTDKKVEERMKELDKISDISTRLIVNKASLKTRSRQIAEITEALK